MTATISGFSQLGTVAFGACIAANTHAWTLRPPQFPNDAQASRDYDFIHTPSPYSSWIRHPSTAVSLVDTPQIPFDVVLSVDLDGRQRRLQSYHHRYLGSGCTCVQPPKTSFNSIITI